MKGREKQMNILECPRYTLEAVSRPEIKIQDDPDSTEILF